MNTGNKERKPLREAGTANIYLRVLGVWAWGPWHVCSG